MLDKPDYKAKWELKKAWYAEHFPDALLLTEESPKLSKAAQSIIQETFV